jgi:hypothetical protein
MARFLSQDLPVNLLGLQPPTGLMMLQRQVEGLLNRQLGHRSYPPM